MDITSASWVSCVDVVIDVDQERSRERRKQIRYIAITWRARQQRCQWMWYLIQCRVVTDDFNVAKTSMNGARARVEEGA